MGAIQSFLSTSGPGALVGALLGWVLFDNFASTDSSCSFGALCVERLWSMDFTAYVTAWAALGGLVGLVWLLVSS